MCLWCGVVWCAPSHLPKFTRRPQITTNEADKEAPVAILDVGFKTGTPPAVAWKGTDGVWIKSDRHLEMKLLDEKRGRYTAQLLIKNYRAFDNGNYMCSITNKNGTIVAYLTLEIEEFIKVVEVSEETPVKSEDRKGGTTPKTEQSGESKDEKSDGKSEKSEEKAEKPGESKPTTPETPITPETPATPETPITPETPKTKKKSATPAYTKSGSILGDTFNFFKGAKKKTAT